MSMLKNAKHEHFAHLVAKGASATEAYVQAGYSCNGAATSGMRLLKNADICSRVAGIRANVIAIAAEKTSVTKAWVLEQLVETVAMAKAAEPVLDGEGKPIGEYKQNLAAGNRALELIGKELGMFIDRKEIRTGDLDDIPHEDKKVAMDAVKQEIERRGAEVRLH
jgi:hypothetical protein